MEVKLMILLCILPVWLPCGQSHCTEEEQCQEKVGEPVIFSQLSSPSPGLKFVITNNGLDYLTKIGIPMLENGLKASLSIPEISGRYATARYEIKNIKLMKIYFGSSTISASPERGLLLKLADTSAEVIGDWSYKFLLKKDHGTFKVSIRDIFLDVGVLFDVGDKGQVYIPDTKLNCKLNIGHLSVKFKGGSSRLLNLFDDVIGDKLKHLLKEKICELFTNDVKKALGLLPAIAVGDGIKLNCALLKKPNFTSWMIMTEHKGEFFSDTVPHVEIPFTPVSIPLPLPPLSKMGYLWVTDYMINTATLVYGKVGHLDYSYNITSDMVNELTKQYLQLDTRTFSQVIPELYLKYPNKDLTLSIRTTDEPPTVHITPQGIEATIPGTIDFYVADDKGDTTLAVTLGITAVLNVYLRVHNGNNGSLLLKGNATYDNAELKVLATNIGDITDKSVDNFKNMISFLFQVILLPFIDRLSSEGYLVPVPVKGLAFQNTNLILSEGYAVFETDAS